MIRRKHLHPNNRFVAGHEESGFFNQYGTVMSPWGRAFQKVLCTMSFLLALLSSCAAHHTGPSNVSHPLNKFPDPLQLNDGKRVKTAEAWKARRAEIIEIVLSIEYGHMPPSPENVAVKSEAVPELISLSEKLALPVSLDRSSYRNFPSHHAHNVGAFSLGSPWVKNGADVIVFVGSRDVGGKVVPKAPEFPSSARVIRVGMDTGAMSRNYATDWP